ncbi:MAG: cytochrome c oxidase subunit I [Chloroflexi bacterium]|nr:cytochrome c oxidase subunit I [Chloroflexota bacterium]
MAIAQGHVGHVSAPPATTVPAGLAGWLSTVDHKRIGIIYMLAAFVFFIIGGIEALLMRVQLGTPENTFLTPDFYNQLFTMHGTTMIFLAVMPMNVGLGNYVVPLMIGARDMAFPRLNAMSVWLFILGGLMLYFSFFAGGAPNVGWFAYAPLTQKPYSPTFGVDYWILGLLLTGVASIAGALNFIVTILNMRAPGLSLNRMPLFVWMQLIVGFILVFAFPALTVAQIELLFDRHFGTRFFVPSQGGDAVLWQHLFWFFGHPEVYILILPVMGIVSETLPTFSRKPIFGYAFVAFSGVAIGFLGFLVWAHHMFGVGLGPLANAFFAGASFLIAVPTGVKIFNWIATMYDGALSLTTSMLYSIGFIAMFIIGGLSGITLASPPVDLQQTDSYYVVAHLHYVLFGGSILGLFAGVFYWFPKVTGRMLDERLGKVQFWLMMISFNVTFFPMHIIGTDGMPRRIYTYESGMGWDLWNLVATVGAFLMAASVLLFLWNLMVSLRRGAPAGNDPWDAATLEWSVSSPPPPHNFDQIPVVHSRRPLWDHKYPEHAGDGHGASAPDPLVAGFEQPAIHLPSPTYHPLILGVGLTTLFFGILYSSIPPLSISLAVVGLALVAFAIVGWVRDSHKDSPYAAH